MTEEYVGSCNEPGGPSPCPLPNFRFRVTVWLVHGSGFRFQNSVLDFGSGRRFRDPVPGFGSGFRVSVPGFGYRIGLPGGPGLYSAKDRPAGPCAPAIPNAQVRSPTRNRTSAEALSWAEAHCRGTLSEPTVVQNVVQDQGGLAERHLPLQVLAPLHSRMRGQNARLTVGSCSKLKV